MSELDCSDWSNGVRYNLFVTRPDTEFKLKRFWSHHALGSYSDNKDSDELGSGRV
jgi:hypothetical protein